MPHWIPADGAALFPDSASAPASTHAAAAAGAVAAPTGPRQGS